jgi:lipopolysaccharide biosynthesis protein
MEKNKKARVIAFYLPQFHPIPENDEGWGKGFTDWTNVTKARPLFKGHYQPHVPADLGFYDLRVPEVREQQAAMAKEYGIYGFCYYHYWFNGKRLLERPFNEVLKTGKPDFPFMLCWANENWTKKWNGGDKAILMKQDYNENDDVNHICYLLDNVFCDPRYIRINNKPVFCIYRSTLFPDMKRTIEIWRKEARKRGIDLYLCRMESFIQSGAEYLQDGFDASIEFQPHSNWSIYNQHHNHNIFHLINRVTNKILKQEFFPTIISYKKYSKFVSDLPVPDYKRFPCITPSWDNAARMKRNFWLLYGSSPALYKQWLSATIRKFISYSEEENLLFINAWNEWAEGNHLEPDIKFGCGYLESTKEVLNEYV